MRCVRGQRVREGIGCLQPWVDGYGYPSGPQRVTQTLQLCHYGPPPPAAVLACVYMCVYRGVCVCIYWLPNLFTYTSVQIRRYVVESFQLYELIAFKEEERSECVCGTFSPSGQ